MKIITLRSMTNLGRTLFIKQSIHNIGVEHSSQFILIKKLEKKIVWFAVAKRRKISLL